MGSTTLRSLRAKLRRLATHALEKSNEAAKKGQMRKVQIPYLREKIAFKGSSAYQMYLTKEAIERWNAKDKEALLKAILSSKEGNDALEEIEKSHKGNSLLVLQRLIGSIIDGNDNEQSRLLADALARTLRGLPISRTLIAHLHGIEVEGSISTSSGLVLRRPVPEDVERSVHVELAAYNLGLRKDELPQAILIINRESRSEREMQHELRRTLAALRLYKIGEVTYSEYSITSDSVLDLGGTHRHLDTTHTAERYGVSEEEEDSFNSFLERVLPSIPSDWIDVPYRPSNEVAVAYRRYCDASIRDVPHKRIALAVMGLEALFLNKGADLDRKLGQRLARLMMYTGMRPNITYQNVTKAYSIRSDYVHGSHVKEEDNSESSGHQELNELMMYILNLLRKGVLFHIANPKLAKDKIIHYVEHTLIGMETAEKRIKSAMGRFESLEFGKIVSDALNTT